MRVGTGGVVEPNQSIFGVAADATISVLQASGLAEGCDSQFLSWSVSSCSEHTVERHE